MKKELLNAKVRNIPVPSRLENLQIDKNGFPVPWFVPRVKGEWEFRGMDGEKFERAVREKRCWICGDVLGRHLTFPIGPMCAVTRTTAEPPSHLSCCEYSVKVCPFLTQPRMRRNEKDMPENGFVAGVAIKRNPGVTVLWTTGSFKMFRSGPGYLFKIGDPEHIEYYTEGRKATYEECLASIDSGMPILEKMANEEGPAAVLELKGYHAKALKVLSETSP